jgi:hypothetical protein
VAEDFNEQWWREEREDGTGGRVGPAAWRHAAWVESRQFEHHQQLLYNARQYSNREISAFDWGWGRTTHTDLLPYREVTDDVVGQVVAAHIASVGKSKVKARPKTKKASFKLRRASRKLDRYLYAEAKRLDFWEAHKQGFADACWGEVGAIYWDYNDEGVFCERVFPDELLVDNDECSAEPKPTAVFRRRAVHVESVISQWGLEAEAADALRNETKQSNDRGWLADRGPAPGWIVVVEVHRLATGNDKGRHVIGTCNLTLLDEDWDEDWLPYTFFHYQKPVSGFYCRSAVEKAMPWQRRIDKLNACIEDAQDLACRMRIWNPLGSKIDVKELVNRNGKVITSAIKPETLQWQTNVQELYQERRYQKEECLAAFGITPFASQGKLPNGTRLDSSKALNEYSQINDDLQVDLAQRYEAFQMAGYDMLVKVSERAHKAGAKLKTTWVAGKRVEEINWDDIDYSRDRYVLQVEPSSTMNESMAAHLDETAKMVQAGIITPEEYLSLQSTPDTEKLISLRVVSIENAYATIEKIEEGKYVPPSPLQDLNTCVQLMHFHQLDLENEYPDVPQAVLQNMTLWIMQAKWIMEMGADFSSQGSEVGSQGVPPGGPGVPPGGGMPTGVPMDPSMLPAFQGAPPMAAATAPSLVPNASQLG